MIRENGLALNVLDVNKLVLRDLSLGVLRV